MEIHTIQVGQKGLALLRKCIPEGGGNPGTPAYVGMIGIILRRQKNTSRYLGITPLLVKLAYCLPPKNIWYDT